MLYKIYKVIQLWKDRTLKLKLIIKNKDNMFVKIISS
jgi:hypothetical protein